MVEMAGPARLAAASRARVFGGVRAGRSGSAMRCQPRGARRCSRRSWPVLGSSSRTWASFHCTSTGRPIQAGRRTVVGRRDLDAAVQWSWPNSVDRSTLCPGRCRSEVAPRGGGLRDAPRLSLGAVVVRLDISVTGERATPLQRQDVIVVHTAVASALPERFVPHPPRRSPEGCAGSAIAVSRREVGQLADALLVAAECVAVAPDSAARMTASSFLLCLIPFVSSFSCSSCRAPQLGGAPPWAHTAPSVPARFQSPGLPGVAADDGLDPLVGHADLTSRQSVSARQRQQVFDSMTLLRLGVPRHFRSPASVPAASTAPTPSLAAVATKSASDQPTGTPRWCPRKSCSAPAERLEQCRRAARLTSVRRKTRKSLILQGVTADFKWRRSSRCRILCG